MVSAKPLHERTAVIGELGRYYFERTRHLKLAEIHEPNSISASQTRLADESRLIASERAKANVKILVTGGAGFIGSNFVRRTLEDAYPGLEGAHVVVLDALTYSGNEANLASVAQSPRYTFVRGDIRDTALLDQLLPGLDAVVHFAAESHVDRSVRDASIFVETNVVGTQRLLDAALRHSLPRFVHVSTDEVYGSIAEGSWDENRPLEPNSPYSASKAGSDLLARSYVKTHGLNLSITRCSNNYGPFHFPEKVIPLFVTNLIDDLHVPLYGEGNNIRDWLHVDDHCRGIAMVLAQGRAGEVYNIGGGTELTNKELTQLLLDATGKDWSYVDRVADRLGHDLRYSVDISKISGELGYQPQVNFDQGLADVVQWYRDNREWWEPLKARAALS
jgi:dTDP-glucose 4,6-dehydratase